jgi:hypothetical protein
MMATKGEVEREECEGNVDEETSPKRQRQQKEKEKRPRRGPNGVGEKKQRKKWEEERRKKSCASNSPSIQATAVTRFKLLVIAIQHTERCR